MMLYLRKSKHIDPDGGAWDYAIAVKDASQVENGQAYMLLSAADIPETLSDENKSYIERGFIGYVNPPRKIYLYVLPEAVENLNEALAYFETVRFDYLVGPPDLEETEAEEVEKWIKHNGETIAHPVLFCHTKLPTLRLSSTLRRTRSKRVTIHTQRHSIAAAWPG